jgi:branched-subunit amino acid ABC-type transport system permease component
VCVYIYVCTYVCVCVCVCVLHFCFRHTQVGLAMAHNKEDERLVSLIAAAGMQPRHATELVRCSNSVTIFLFLERRATD